MEVKYQIFVSSTFTDLQEERRKVIEMIMNMGHIPIGMEAFQASDSTQWEYITRRIDESDYYVVIIAERYGSMLDGKSYTQMEYEYATAKGIPVVAFLLADHVRRTLPVDRVDVDLRMQVEAFRNLAKEKLSKFWTNPDDLSGKVALALHELFRDKPRNGWVKASTVPSMQVMEEISRLSEEKRLLQEKLSALSGNTSITVPPDVVYRIQEMSMSFINEYFDGYHIEDELASVLDMFLACHKRLAIGCAPYELIQTLRLHFDKIEGTDMEDVAKLLAEFSSHNLVEFTQTPKKNGINTTFHLTTYGKDFAMYANKYLIDQMIR
ncbi:DUF4062 domain-containing protein [Rhizobium leguminosarum]|uniref:DUF4062 domain-containing protein n=1 Tax=Rhizobium leguminosarum TaxID=384 RepID=UPI0003A0776D|nr:DUF4062 domain-containing protein [Rhizobium leguminosarum]